MTEAWYEAGLAYMKAGEDEVTARDMLDTAAQYMMSLGAPEEKIGEDKVLDLTIKSIALHWFDHRDSVGEDKAFPAGCRALITKCKMTYGL